MTDVPDSGEPLLYALLDLSFALADRTNVLVAEVLTELGLTQPLADALWHLDPQAPPPAMRGLATKLRCDPSTVTFLADRREREPGPRRTKPRVRTRAGRAARRRLVDAMATRSPLARLTLAEQRTLYGLLTRAVGADTALDADTAPES